MDAVIGAAGRSDAGAFLVRLLRLDPAAVVRLRPPRLHRDETADFAAEPDAPLASFAAEPDARLASFAELWAVLPFGVAVCRAVAAVEPGDITVSAAELLDHLTAGGRRPERRDEAWRWPLPSQPGRAIEAIPATEIERVAKAASRTLRSVSEGGLGGRRLGERVVRDALLDHVPIVVTTADGASQVEVPQRLVQAVVRMGFVMNRHQPGVANLTQGETLVTVRQAGQWIGLDCSYGSGWYLPISPLHFSQGVDVRGGTFG
jgi:hypothetical protein